MTLKVSKRDTMDMLDWVKVLNGLYENLSLYEHVKVKAYWSSCSVSFVF